MMTATRRIILLTNLLVKLMRHLPRLFWLLGKLNADYTHKTDYFVHKFMYKVEGAFATLPDAVQWQSFYMHDLREYVTMPEEGNNVFSLPQERR